VSVLISLAGKDLPALINQESTYIHDRDTANV
jgi:hypothetical protein